MTTIQQLAVLAKQSFNIAAAVEAYRPEGLAIEMKSGLIVTGHSYDGVNAANDALRSLKSFYNTRQPKSFDEFTIMSAVVIVEPKMRKSKEVLKASDTLIQTLQKCLPVDPQAILSVASSRLVDFDPQSMRKIPLIKNLLLDRSL